MPEKRCYICGAIYPCEKCGGQTCNVPPGFIGLPQQEVTGNSGFVDLVLRFRKCPDCKDGWREAETSKFLSTLGGVIQGADPTVVCPECERKEKNDGDQR